MIKFYENMKFIYCVIRNDSPDYPTLTLKGEKEPLNFERYNFRTCKRKLYFTLSYKLVIPISDTDMNKINTIGI